MVIYRRSDKIMLSPFMLMNTNIYDTSIPIYMYEAHPEIKKKILLKEDRSLWVNLRNVLQPLRQLSVFLYSYKLDIPVLY